MSFHFSKAYFLSFLVWSSFAVTSLGQLESEPHPPPEEPPVANEFRAWTFKDGEKTSSQKLLEKLKALPQEWKVSKMKDGWVLFAYEVDGKLVKLNAGIKQSDLIEEDQELLRKLQPQIAEQARYAQWMKELESVQPDKTLPFKAMETHVRRMNDLVTTIRYPTETQERAAWLDKLKTHCDTLEKVVEEPITKQRLKTLSKIIDLRVVSEKEPTAAALRVAIQRAFVLVTREATVDDASVLIPLIRKLAKNESLARVFPREIRELETYALTLEARQSGEKRRSSMARKNMSVVLANRATENGPVKFVLTESIPEIGAIGDIQTLQSDDFVLPEGGKSIAFWDGLKWVMFYFVQDGKVEFTFHEVTDTGFWKADFVPKRGIDPSEKQEPPLVPGTPVQTPRSNSAGRTGPRTSLGLPYSVSLAHIALPMVAFLETDEQADVDGNGISLSEDQTVQEKETLATLRTRLSEAVDQATKAGDAAAARQKELGEKTEETLRAMVRWMDDENKEKPDNVWKQVNPKAHEFDKLDSEAKPAIDQFQERVVAIWNDIIAPNLNIDDVDTFKKQSEEKQREWFAKLDRESQDSCLEDLKAKSLPGILGGDPLEDFMAGVLFLSNFENTMNDSISRLERYRTVFEVAKDEAMILVADMRSRSPHETVEPNDLVTIREELNTNTKDILILQGEMKGIKGLEGRVAFLEDRRERDDFHRGRIDFSQGTHHFWDGKWNLAIERLQAATRLSPKWADPYYFLAFAYGCKGEKTLATKELEFALVLDRRKPIKYWNHLMRRFQGSLRQQIEQLRSRALAGMPIPLSPDMWDAWKDGTELGIQPIGTMLPEASAFFPTGTQLGTPTRRFCAFR